MRRRLFLVFACLAAALAATALAQRAVGQPTFEVASVKPYRPVEGRGVSAGGASSDPTRYSAQTSLMHLISVAYDVQSIQIISGPGWISTDLYEVDARPARPSTPDEMMLMLRSLLADRFGLRFHKDTRSLLVNVLSVAKGGPKFGPQFHQVQEAGPPAGGSPMQGRTQHFSQFSMKRFCSIIEQRLLVSFRNGALVEHSDDWHPVLDQTGLAGVYDITLNADADESWPAMLEHQLGLKLEARKAPVEVMVIDQAERPTPN